MYDFDLGGPARLWEPAANAMSAMLFAARQENRIIIIAYSYRTIAKQWEKWWNYQSGGNLAASPGTSNHGDAITCDLTSLDSADLTWLYANARRFGYRADVPGEVWHWTYYGSKDFDPGDWEEEEDVEKYHEGQTRFAVRWKENLDKHPFEDPDPGPPPDEWTKEIKWGWNDARFQANNAFRLSKGE
jgi:hypothetical protein